MDRARGNDVLSIKVYQGDAPTCPIEDILMKKYNFWSYVRNLATLDANLEIERH